MKQKRKSGRKLLSFLLALAMIVGLMPGMSLAYAAGGTDVLTREDTGRTGTGYGGWSGVTKSSGAVYAGLSAGDHESIQLRSNNNNSGIVTTTSGGKATKVRVVWNSNTTNGRTLNVYGKNSAYSAASDLYGGDQGDLLGTIVCGQSTELTISGDYTYIGMRSNSGAMYLDSIAIEWGGSTPATVAVTGVTLNPSAAQTIDVDGTVSFTATVSPDDATDKKVKWSVGGTDAGAVKLYSDEACENEVALNTATETLTVYVKGISAGSATVTCTSNADSNKSASCDVTVTDPLADVDVNLPYTFTTDNYTYNIYYDDSEHVSKIRKIEALIRIEGEPSWGVIQVCNGGPQIKISRFTDMGKGIHMYTWTDDIADENTSYLGTYAQIVLAPKTGDNGALGQLLAYRVTFNDNTETIEAGDWKYPVCVAPTGLTATYGQTLADVTIPTATNGKWTWADGNASVGNVGSKTFKANFTPTDTPNYNTVSNVDITVTVNKAANPLAYAEMQTVTKTFSTSAQTETLAVATNGQGIVSYAISSQKNSANADVSHFNLNGTTMNIAANTPAGTYTVVVRATAAGNDSYNSGTKDSTVTVTVNKATAPAVTAPTLNAVTYEPNQTLGSVTLPAGWTWVTDTTTVPTVGNSGYSAALTVDDANYDYSSVTGYDTASHKVTRTVSLNVNKAAVTAPTIESKIYNTQAQTADIAGNDLYEVTSNAGGINVGEYDVVLTLKDTANYKWADSNEVAKTLKFNITQATAPTINVPTPEAVTYDPAKTLANVALTDGWTWVTDTTVPTVVNSGYSAELTVDDANYNYTTDVEGYNAETHKVTRTVSLSVNKANAVSATVTANNRTYDGSEKPLVNVNNSTLVGGEMQYALGTTTEATQPYTTSIPTAINAGTYYVWYKVAGDENHNDSGAKSVAVTISRATVGEETGRVDDTASGAPKVESDNIAKVAGEVLEDEEREAVASGAVAELVLVVEPIAEKDVPPADKGALSSAADTFGAKEGAWVDLSLLLKVTGRADRPVPSTTTAVKFSLEVPESLRNKAAGVTRTFWLLRCHDGKADKVAGPTTGTTLSGESDLFSTYLVAYSDEEEADPKQYVPGPATPSKGGGSLSSKVSRLAGADRYATMADLVSLGFSSAKGAVVASGASFADALAASALAGARGCPVVLTDPAALSPQASSLLDGLGASDVTVVGGPAAVSDAVAGGLGASRVAGEDRYATAVETMRTARAIDASSDTVVVATGTGFADALSIGPWAWSSKSPILLALPDGTLRQDAVDAILADAGISRVLLVGGTAVVSDAIESQLGDSYGYERLGGANRYETSARIAEFSASDGLGWSKPVVATGRGYADALSAAAVCGANRSVLLLADSASDPTIALLRESRSGVARAYVAGGTGAVPASVESAVRSALS